MRLIGTTRSRTTALVAAVACAGVVVAVPTAATGRPTAVGARSVSAHPADGDAPAPVHEGQPGLRPGRDTRPCATPTSSTPGVSRWGRRAPLWVANNHSATSTIYTGGGGGASHHQAGAHGLDPRRRPDRPGLQRHLRLQAQGRLTGEVHLRQRVRAHHGVERRPDADHHGGDRLLHDQRELQGPRPAQGRPPRMAARVGLPAQQESRSSTRGSTKVSFGPRAFKDSRIPKGYAPFNVAVIGTKVLVSYAKQGPGEDDDVPGAAPRVRRRLHEQGQARRSGSSGAVRSTRHGESRWHPRDSATSRGSLLVGNFGDGLIHVYSLRTGHLIGTLRKPTATRSGSPGLWALLPGNGVAGAKSDVWFSAGPGDEDHGLLGIIRHA